MLAKLGRLPRVEGFLAVLHDLLGDCASGEWRTLDSGRDAVQGDLFLERASRVR